MTTTSDFLQHYFEPVTGALTRQLAQTIIDLRPDAEITARVEELGRKANIGTITDEEDQEYRYYIDAGDMIALLKAKARRFLANQTT